MRIDKFSFGQIVLKGKKYDHDVFVTNKSVEEKESSHEITRDDIDRALFLEPDLIIIGKGTSGMVEIPEEIKAMVARNKVRLIEGNTPDVIKDFNKLSAKNKIVGIFHLTC